MISIGFSFHISNHLILCIFEPYNSKFKQLKKKLLNHLTLKHIISILI